MILAAITAAGASTRMGRHKALLPFRGSTVLASMLAALSRAGFARTAVVTGADAERVAAEASRAGAEDVRNVHHERGRFTSVRVAARWAIAAKGDAETIALLLWPVDCPAVTDATLCALRRAAAEAPRANVVPAFGGRAGHPIVLCAATLDEIAAAPDDANLRDLVRRAPAGRVVVDVDDPRVLDNLNTPDDYDALLALVGRGTRR